MFPHHVTYQRPLLRALVLQDEERTVSEAPTQHQSPGLFSTLLQMVCRPHLLLGQVEGIWLSV